MIEDRVTAAIAAADKVLRVAREGRGSRMDPAEFQELQRAMFKAAIEASDAGAEAKRVEVTRENDVLRTLLARSDKDCAYCGLPAADITRCERGFPGCDRMDDLMAVPPAIPHPAAEPPT